MSSNKNQELAEDRTDWAEDRTILANERTFAGWMRTGMACTALAVGLNAVFSDFDPTWIAQSVASIFLIAACGIFWSARNRACVTLARLDQSDAKAQPSRNFTVLASTMTAGTIGVGAILWLI